MRFRSIYTGAGVIGATFAVGATSAVANPNIATREFIVPTLALDQHAKEAASKPANGKPAEKKAAEKPADKAAAKPAEATASSEKTTTTTTASSEYGFGGLGDFWNVREANSNLKQGQWNLETTWGWSTTSNNSDDDITGAAALRYGVTDDLFVELEVFPINFGDGSDQGNGDLGVIVFWNPIKETDATPAFGTYLEGRAPSGDGSRGVDAEWHWILTKTIVPKVRVHMEGYIMTANGGRTGGQDDGRRPFQWGAGPGMDIAITDKTKMVANFIHRSADQYGNQNSNIVEAGIAHSLGENQYVCVGVDIGLDQVGDTPNSVIKAQWGITWK